MWILEVLFVTFLEVSLKALVWKPGCHFSPFHFCARLVKKRFVSEVFVIFGGGFVENVRFGSLLCCFLWKSRGKDLYTLEVTRVFCRRALQECLARRSLQRVPHTSIVQECFARVLYKKVFCEGALEACIQERSQWILAPGFVLLFHDLTELFIKHEMSPARNP